jgi:putative oxidoreductase
MPAPVPLQRAAQLGLRAAAALAFLAPLATRITMGHVFILTGNGKIEHLDTFTEFLAEKNVPFPALNAAFVSRLEFWGGILIVAGLLTRLMAAALGSTMVVALWTERAQFFDAWKTTGEVGPVDISSWVCLLFFSWLIFYGPGPISLDWFLARWLGVFKPQQPPAPAREAA